MLPPFIPSIRHFVRILRQAGLQAPIQHSSDLPQKPRGSTRASHFFIGYHLICWREATHSGSCHESTARGACQLRACVVGGVGERGG